MSNTFNKDHIAKLLAEVREKKKTEVSPPPASPTPDSATIAKQALADKLAAIRSRMNKPADKQQALEELKTETLSIDSDPAKFMHYDKYGNPIIYNEKQDQFVKMVQEGKSVVLIGSAGTGKTTCVQGGLLARIQSGALPQLRSDGHKHLVSGTPGCVIIAYTRRATNNIRAILSEDLKQNAITAHKLLEFKPEFYEVYDEAEGKMKNTMRFEPTRNSSNPLPDTLATIVVEESSMLSTDLYHQIEEALDHKVQWIFLGDINQLPPVFGPAILGFKMLELPVIELTEVYRQALKSPIIRLAHRILSGKPLPVGLFDDWNVKGELTIHPWKKKIAEDTAVMTLAAFFNKSYDNGTYNPETDIVLLPFNKACGTLELNKYIANHIARKYQRTTYEVIAGFNKHYFTVGDKVLYEKEDAEIIEINTNAEYTGARFQQESKHLDYWGHNPKAAEEFRTDRQMTDDDIDFLLETVAADKDEDRVRKASHVITVKLADTGDEISVNTASEVNSLLHAYALTIHKAQGSEWEKVYLCFHQSHSTMVYREILYTGVTRAKKELYVICEPDTFVKGIVRQRIKGNTLAQKAEYFKGKTLNKR